MTEDAAAGRRVGDMEKDRCMICAKPGAYKGGICDPCKAKVRGEVLEQQHRDKKEADRSLHKEGTAGERKGGG
ncbi:MAG: hypothetical protein H6Q84_866 [Deltaproteobacteria bacterium]|nr:hypothetical protein [Deltaproteobacteria bacterium]